MFSANPSTYNRSGKVIPQLKDRIGTTVVTHYPRQRELGIDIMRQEAGIELEGEHPVLVPPFMEEIIEQISIAARKSNYVDQESGVSARFSVANYRTMVASARQRAIRLGESPAVPRISDLGHLYSSSLGKLELDADLLPPVFESEDVTGTLTTAAAKQLGLTTDCKVVGGAGDCAAGAVGNGVVRSGVLSTSVGTSGVMFVHSDQPEYDATGRLHTFCHAVRGKWHMMGVNLTSGGSLQWWVDSILQGLSGIDSKQRYEAATREAAAAAAGSGGLLFLPYLNGERTPHADPQARGAFVGLNTTHTRGQLTRAVMEGVTFALRDSLEIIQSMGVPVREIRASGGGSKNPLWRQMQADVFGKKVGTLEVEQGPAFGVALLAAVGDGAYKSIEQACKATIKVADTTPADRAATKTYNALFPIYRNLYGSLKQDFAELAALQ